MEAIVNKVTEAPEVVEPKVVEPKVTDIFAEYATDPKKEIEGAWVPFGKGKVLVARLGNRKYARALAQKIEANSEALSARDDAADQLSDRLMAEVFAETILFGWTEEIKYDGKAYSPEVAVEALSHNDFRQKIMELAGIVNNYRLKAEKAQGNA